MSYVAEERQKHTIYPPENEVFTWTQTCDIQDVSWVSGSCKAGQNNWLFSGLLSLAKNETKIDHKSTCSYKDLLLI